MKPTQSKTQIEKVKAKAFDYELEIEVYPRNMMNRPYFVYEGKIWRWVSKHGVGKNFTMVGEREQAKEKIVLKGMTPEMAKVRWVITQTGHITL